jgi:DNA-binding NarL/FixJ family response regulator
MDTGAAGRDHRPMTVRVLVVDDHAEVRGLIRRLLEADGLEVVGEAGDGASALSQAARLRPDVVLMDVLLPGADGIATAEALARSPRPAPVVLTSSREAADLGDRLAAAAALGFVPKRELSGAVLVGLLAGAGAS